MTTRQATAIRVRAAALDLGSTRFKLGTLDDAGRLIAVRSVPAPALSGTGLIRENGPDAILRAIDELFAKDAATGSPSPEQSDAMPLGLVCQRSTFLIWDRHDGSVLTPVVSWQDRRAEDWCARHADIEPVLVERTGLLLSPHYAGPKLAAMLAADTSLAARLHAGDALFGNLDAWLTWRWSGGELHQTDVTMAARTAMFAIETGDWDAELLQRFGVPRAALPEVTGSVQGHPVSMAGRQLRGSIADQAAGAAAMIPPGPVAQSGCLVNFGTGAFVLQPVDGPEVRRPGYLTGPMLVSTRYGTRFAIEGTINGSGTAIDRFGPGPTPLPGADTCPDAFMIPDASGVGAPHWRADIGLTMSSAARVLARSQQRLVCLEGLLFRVAEILHGLNENGLPGQILVAGGLAGEPAVAGGLAALLDRPVRLLDEPEATLLGAARLAGGRPPYADPAFETIEPGDPGRYLAAKFERWKAWCASVYDASDQ